jgi:hypothetical protein
LTGKFGAQVFRIRLFHVFELSRCSVH